MSKTPNQNCLQNRHSLARRGDMIVTKWGARFHGRVIPCAIGRGGIGANKTEGDGVSPAGPWRIMGGGFRPDRLNPPKTLMRLKPIVPFDIWSDDVNDCAYNQGAHAIDYAYSHEKMRRADRLYDVVLITDWNWPDAVAGRGSAIFVHQWRAPRYPTAGCIAFAPKDLRWVLQRWTSRARILVR